MPKQKALDDKIPAPSADQNGSPKQDMWDELLRELGPRTDGLDSAAWEEAVQQVRQKDPRRILESQRFMGPGE